MSSPTLPAVVQHGTGLVVMLDAAGRTIADLEQRVEQLATALVAERQQRAELEALLAELRSATPDVQRPGRHVGEDCSHDRPATTAT